jgi:hypothetical protein
MLSGKLSKDRSWMLGFILTAIASIIVLIIVMRI